MIINLTKSKLFTVEPAKRFAKEFNVDEKIWLQCWLKYKVLDLNVRELMDYIHIKTGRKPSHDSVERWIVLTEIYSRALEAFKMGATVVNTSFFGRYEEALVKDLLRNMESGATKNNKSMI